MLEIISVSILEVFEFIILLSDIDDIFNNFFFIKN